MQKILMLIATVCFTLAAGLSFAETKPKTLDFFTPTEDTYPLAPNEHAVELRKQYGFYVYRLEDEKGQCTGVALANTKTKAYQRLNDIGCDPTIDHVSFSPSEIDKYVTLNFYHNTVNVGRMTIPQ